jgi:F0F1-type ATP synthase membrane subunit a
MLSLFEHLDLAFVHIKVSENMHVAFTDTFIISLLISLTIGYITFSPKIKNKTNYQGLTRTFELSKITSITDIKASSIYNKFLPYLDSIILTVAKGHLKWNYYRYRPLIITIGLTIFIANITSLIPGIYPLTALFLLPLILSSAVNLAFTLYGFMREGYGFLKFLLPVEVYPEPMVVRLLFPFCELLSYFVRFLTLPLRVSCSMFTGHLMLEFLSAIIFGFLANGGISGTALGLTVWALLAFVLFVEILAAVAQTYIFLLLSAYYIGGNISKGVVN